AALAQGAAEARAALRPADGVMAQLVHFDAGPEAQGRLLLTLHHLVVDGVTWRILLPDLVTAWAAVSTGRTPVLDPVPTSFRRWAQRLVAEATDPGRVAELDTWSEILRTPDPLLGDRPLDPRTDTFGTSRQLTVELPADVTEPLLTTVPAAFHGRVNDVLLTGLALAVARRRRTGDTAVLLHLEGHGREEIVPGVDLSRTAGWFTAIHPVRLDPGPVAWDDVVAGGQPAGTALKLVKEQLRDIPDNGVGYGLLRHLNPRTSAALAGRPAPQIAFNYLGRVAAHEDGAAGDWSPAGPAESDALGGGQNAALGMPHALEISAHTRDLPTGPRLSATWIWPGGLLAEADVRALAEDWFTALRGLVEHAATDGAGGFTPSDLSLVSLSQDEIDEFAAELDELDEWESH
ncbi:MAG TPA: condensation domain-containing protein, partial [Thermomonospora sp.]|nr:condensation domain-containing protein [Thermomonospora sp.]